MCNDLRVHTRLSVDGTVVLSDMNRDWLSQEKELIRLAYEVDPYREARKKRRPHDRHCDDDTEREGEG